jgi:hypothetical protein
MRLFGPSKPKFEDLAVFLEKDSKGMIDFTENSRRTLNTLLSTSEGRKAWFDVWFPALELMGDEVIDQVRKAKDKDEVMFELVRYGDWRDRLEVTVYAEILSGLVLATRRMMLDLYDASNVRNDQKIAKKFEELKASTLTPEQKEIVDALLKGFKDWGLDFLSKGK